MRDLSILFNKVKCIGVFPVYVHEDKDVGIILLQVGNVVFVGSGIGRQKLMRDVWM